MKGLSYARRRLGVLVLLAGCYCWQPALASLVDFSESSDDIEWMFGMCLIAGGAGFGLGAKIRLTRDISNAA